MYTPLNRFISADMARKNRIIHPSKVLHFFNVPKMSDTELEQLFVKAGAKPPMQVKWLPAKNDAKVGLATEIKASKKNTHCVFLGFKGNRSILYLFFHNFLNIYFFH